MSQDPYGYSGSPTIQYTIEQALELMRRLPLEGLNERLVVQVVRHTLESAGVSIPHLVELASQRQDQITDEIVRHQGEISTLHREIEEKSKAVQHYQSQLVEIGLLRERLEG